MRVFILITLITAACVDQPNPVETGIAPTLVSAPQGEAIPDPNAAPDCSYLAPNASDCCVLYCADPVAFEQQCKPPPGSPCIQLACPLAGGGFQSPPPEVCP